MNFAIVSLFDQGLRTVRPSRAMRGRRVIPAAFRSFLCASAGLLLVSTGQADLTGGNLLKNPTATGPVTDGWTIITSSGDVGWTIQSGGDGIGGVFATSFTLGSRYQIVDLMPADGTVTEADLDAKPEITASEHVCSSVTFANGGPDKFYLKAQLLAADKTTILAERSYGGPALADQKDTPAAFDFETNASKFSLVFASGSYPKGVRYLRFEDGGRDTGNWAGPYGACFDAARVEFTQDTDGDGMPDVWEAANGTQVTVSDADDDADHDGLTNLQEFTLGTAGNNPDTDGDGLLDGVENGTPAGPNHWGGPDATGTFPLIADSDRDGIPDGQENPDDPYVDLTHPGTDPTMADSDGDGVTDYQEAISGTNPKDPNLFPTFAYTDLMTDDFDGHPVNSITSFAKSGGGAYSPTIVDSGNPFHGKVVKLLSSNSTDTRTALAFDQIQSNARAVRLSFDYSMGDGADGIGVGFFKTSDFAATGPINRGSADAWETPIQGQGIKGVVLGLGGYHSTVMMNSPKDPTRTLAVQSPVNLAGGIYNRVVITAIANAPGTTAFSVDIILDVDSPDSFTLNVFSAVVAEDFDISTDPYRVVIGGRTGGLAMNAMIDNVALATNGVIVPAEKPFMMATSIDPSGTPAKFVMTWSSKSGSTYKLESCETLTGTWTTVDGSVASGGATTTYNIPLPAGSPGRNFFRVTPN